MQGVEVIADNMIIVGVLRRSMIACWKMWCKGQESKMWSSIPKRSSLSSNELSILRPSSVKMGSVLIQIKSKPWWSYHNWQVKKTFADWWAQCPLFKDFIHDTSTTMCSIRQLPKKEVDFQLLPEHGQALNKIKESESVLCFYDPIASNTHRGSSGPPSDRCLSKYFSRESPHWDNIPCRTSSDNSSGTKKETFRKRKKKWLDDYEHWLSRTMLWNSSILSIRNVIC